MAVQEKNLLKPYSLMRHIIYLSTIIFSFLFMSCSDQSTGADDTDADGGEGTLVVTGALDTQHEGISWYAGLAQQEGTYFNLTLHVSDVPPGESQQNAYGFSIRMVGDEGPFNLTTGEFEIGHEAAEENEILMITTYTNRQDGDLKAYGASPEDTGTVTIHSISGTSIEASFDVRLKSGPNIDDGFVTISGSLQAECYSAELGGVQVC